MTTSVKTCFKCLSSKPLQDFYKHSQMGDGHLNKCKKCTKVDVRAARLARIDYYRQYDRMRASMPHRMAKISSISARWRKQHPGRAQAQAKVNYALRTGKIEKQPCFICGQKAEAHHPNYDAPLDVVWLCHPHHMQAHALTLMDS